MRGRESTLCPVGVKDTVEVEDTVRAETHALNCGFGEHCGGGNTRLALREWRTLWEWRTLRALKLTLFIKGMEDTFGVEDKTSPVHCREEGHCGR